MAELEKRRITAGAVLIAVGLALYALERMEGLGGEVVLAVLGLAFLVGYLWRRAYPLLVPAGILLGLAVGIYLDDALASGVEGVVLGLGCGFLFIYVVGLAYERRNVWWPLFPGAALVLLAFPVTEELVRRAFESWPLLLVAVGALLVIAGLVRSKGRPEAPPADDGDSSAPPPPPG